jgi:hypothetical protein
MRLLAAAQLLIEATDCFRQRRKPAIDRGCVETWEFGFSLKNFPPQIYFAARRTTQSPPANKLPLQCCSKFPLPKMSTAFLHNLDPKRK